MISNAEIAENVRRVCKLKGFKESHLLEICGLGKNYLYDFKRSSPKVENLLKMAEKLNVPISLFFENVKEEKENEEMKKYETIEVNIVDDDGSPVDTSFKKHETIKATIEYDEEALVTEYNKLNEIGKKEALKRVLELKHNPMYATPDQFGYTGEETLDVAPADSTKKLAD